MAAHLQDEAHAQSLQDPESFWARQAQQLHWHKHPSRSLKLFTKSLSNGIQYPSYTWFPDGEISTTYNCVDRHVRRGHGASTAIIWDSPVTGCKQKYTYNQLLVEVETLAGVLREEGVRKGDVVLVYSKCKLVSYPKMALISHSADDTFCSLRYPCNCSSWGYPCCCLRRVCTSLPGAKDRCLTACNAHDGIM